MVDDAAPAPADAVDPLEMIRSRRFVVLLLLAGIVGIVVSVAAWAFLEAVYWTQRGVYQDLPDALGFDGVPVWWPLPVLIIAGVIAGCAIQFLPGRGGHIPALGLNAGPTLPNALPGVLLAALASVGLGAVVGPEAPLLALGAGLGIFFAHRVARDGPPQLGTILAAAGMFAGMSFLFGSPLIGAVIVLEAAGLGGSKATLVLLPGLLAAGLGSLVSIGLGSFSGLSMSQIALVPVTLPDFPQPTAVDFLWTILLAIAIALATAGILFLGRRVERVASPRPLVVAPIVGALVAGLAIAFEQSTDKSSSEVLFSGQDALSGLVSDSSTWSLGALALLLVFKGIAYGLSLGSFRGGPTFPMMFLGAAAGIMAAKLPGYDLTPAVAVGIGAGVVSVLRLPLSAVVVATLLTMSSGLGSTPLIVVGVVVAYLVVNALPEQAPPTQPG